MNEKETGSGLFELMQQHLDAEKSRILLLDELQEKATLAYIAREIAEIQRRINRLNKDLPKLKTHSPVDAAILKEAAEFLAQKRDDARQPFLRFIEALTNAHAILIDPSKGHQLREEEKSGEKDEAGPNVLNQSVYSLNLSARAKKRFSRGNIQTIKDLVEHTEDEMRCGRNAKAYESHGFGEKTLEEIIEALQKIGLSFKKE